MSDVSYEKQRILKNRKRSNYIFIILALLVITVTVAALILPAITSENATFCGYSEEHVHTERCYTGALICNLTEESAEDGSAHSHSQECYEFTLSCDLEEHTHKLACMSDPSADVESLEEISTSVGSISLFDDPAKDILSIALSQIGYSESSANYKVLADGESVSGYTRYGQWFGDPYADWNSIFVSFCASFANIDAIPKDADIQNWITLQSMDENGLYRDTSYIPGSGDIIFFDTNTDGIADRAAIIEDICLSDDKLCVIEGDCYGSVKANEYALTGDTIIGYIQLSNRIQQDDTTPSDTLNSTEGTLVSHPMGHTIYQLSSHRLDGTALLCYALILDEDHTSDDWAPNTIDWSANADANYTVAYLLDQGIGTVLTDQQYITHDITNSSYSDISDKLSAIIAHSYPFITAEQMKLELIKAYKNGDTTIDLSCCSENEFIAAAQWAIWDATEAATTDRTASGYEFPEGNSDAIDPLSHAGHTSDDTISAHVKAIRDWLSSRTVPSRLEIADKKIDVIRNVDNTYTATVTVTLNREVVSGEELLISKIVCQNSTIDTVYGEGTSSLTVTFDGLSVDELLASEVSLQVIADKMNVFVHKGDVTDLISGKLQEITYDTSFTLDVATTSVNAVVQWTEHPDGIEGIDVILYADNKPYGTPVTLNDDNGWSYSWDRLIKHSASGDPIAYTLAYSTIPGYLTTSVRSEAEGISYTLTNTRSDSTISFKARAEWTGRLDGDYPKSLTVQLLQNGIDYGAPIVLSSDNNWAYTWESLPESANSIFFEYSVKEIELNGYSSEILFTEEDKTQVATISNKWSPENLTITLEAVDINNPTLQLSGAVFDLFCVSDDDGAVIIPGTTDIIGIKERTVITDDNGRFVLDDLLIGNTYCLVETGAPLGYSRLTGPIVVSVERGGDGQGVARILRGDTWATVAEDGDGICTLSIKNRESYIIPETGGYGIFVYYISGLSLITIAIFFITIKKLNFFRRKRK